jgi:hypothetical protein
MSKEKRERFEIVAAKRVQKVLDSLESLSKCSHRGNYEYSESDIKKMIRAIKEKVLLLELAFKQQGGKSKNEFKF